MTMAASADVYTINPSDLGNATINLEEEFVLGGFKFKVAKNDGATAPAYNKAGDIRLYALNTLEISCQDANMTAASFKISTAGLKRLTTITADPGTIAAQAAGDATVDWSGSAAAVTFTVGAKADFGTDGNTKAGQFDFDQITITTDGPITPYGSVTPPPTPDPVRCTTVAQLLAVDNNAEFTFDGSVTVSYANGPDCFIYDNTGATLLRAASGVFTTIYTPGTILSEFSGKRNDYSGTIQFNPDMASLSTDGDTEVTATICSTAAEVEAATMDTYLMLQKVNITSVDGRNAVVTFEDGTTMNLYNRFCTSLYEPKIEYPEIEDEVVNIYGLRSAYQSNVQVSYISYADYVGIRDIFADGAISINGRDITAPAGAAIYNVNGCRVDGHNLPAGIYVVRTANGAAKVIVR